MLRNAGAGEGNARRDTRGGAALLVLLIIGGALVAAGGIMLRSQDLKARRAEMARTEEAARNELRAAYRSLRQLKPNLALDRAGAAGQLLDTLKSGLTPHYATLKVARYLLEGEALFMKNCSRHADTAEERFDRALELMRVASGDMWQFGMLGRARARMELGKYREAVGDLDHVLDRNPSYGSAYYWRSLARGALGDAAGAGADEARARRLDAWPPLRDFMQPAPAWTRDIMTRSSFDSDSSR